MDHARSSSVSAEIFCVQPTKHISFGISFKLRKWLWQRSGHPIVLVGQESKLGSGESKMSKILIIACVQAIGHSFCQIYFILSA